MKSKSPSFPVGWILFFVFLAINILLAFGPFPLLGKLWVAVIGFLVILALLAKAPLAALPKERVPFYQQEFLPPIPLWAWAAFLTLALFFRFYKLTTLSTWPNPDEAFTAAIALHLSQNWEWRFFFAHSQATFPYFGGLALLFKLFGPSLTTLWIFPAVFSALQIPLGYLATRQFFSRGLSFLLTALLALSFWGLYIGRLGIHLVPLPLVELLAFYLLGKLLAEPVKGRLKFRVGLLAFGLGLGFYIHPPAWAPLAFFISICALKIAWDKRVKGLVLFFILVLSAALFPIVLAGIRENYGTYFGTLANQQGSFFSLRQFLISASYITGLFCGKMEGDYYGPYWGGLFDPLTGALFFMGLVQAWRRRNDHLVQSVAVIFLLALLPGILSNNLEFFRILLVFPMVLCLAAWGFQSLALEVPSKSRVLLATGFLLSIGLLNIYHLVDPYQNHWKKSGPQWGYYKSPESYRAFQVLRGFTDRLGPVLLLTNLQTDMSDQSLALASYPFNAALNPRLSATTPAWFAFVANMNYLPFLTQRFSGGQWIPLSEDLNRQDGGLFLGICPLRAEDSAFLTHWLKINRAFLETAYVFLNRPTGTGYDGVIQTLLAQRDLARGDRFLESCYWEKLYYLYLQNRAFGDRTLSPNLQASLECLESSLVYGYPAAHLYNELGTYMVMMKKYPEAAKAFQRALVSNPNFSPARENLLSLRRIAP